MREETGEELSEPDSSITVRQRRTISLRQVAATAFKRYPRRTALGFALFIGQAFIYNAVTFDLGTLLSEFFDIDSGSGPDLHRAVRGLQLPRPGAARPPVRHGRAQADDRGHLHRLGGRADRC